MDLKEEADKLLTNSWMNNATFLAQAGHFLLCYSMVLTGEFLFGHIAAVVVAALMLGYGVVKEFWYDMKFELPKQTWGDSILDFCFLVFGIIFALVMIFFIK